VSSDAQMAEAARMLRQAKAVAVLTGAGISAESGVPTFRGPEGLWRKFRPEQLATPEAFARDPALVWEWYGWRRARMAAVKPNPGHQAIARLETKFPSLTVVTQNIDGLHAQAGTRRLIELHGNIWRDRCTNDPAHVFDRHPDAAAGTADAKVGTADAKAGTADAKVGYTHAANRKVGRDTCPPTDLPRCHCDALLRPDVVWFGEALDPANLQAAITAVELAQVVLVVGTSSVVYPAAALPGVARRAGATVIEVNPEETPLSEEADIVLRGASGVVLPALERLAGLTPD
jgi:NAD-dependent deacetylase